MNFNGVKKISITNSFFNGNHSQSSGGVIFAREIDSLLIENSSFVADTSDHEGGAIHLSDKNEFVRILKSTFSNNSASGAGAINSWNTDSLFIDNSTFDGNESMAGGGGAVSINSDTDISTYFEIKNSDFTGNKAGVLGGAIWIGSSIVQIGNVDFIGNKAGGGGAIHGHQLEEISIYNSIFQENTSNIHEGGAMLINGDGNDVVYIDSTTFEANVDSTGPGGAIQLSNIAKGIIKNSNFMENKAKLNGGGISSWNTDSLFIKNSNFDGNESTDGNGGAMTVSGDVNSTLYSEIKNTTFENNSGGWGGAIAAFEPINMNIDSVFATGNEASGNGSFIELCCGASVSITNSTIYNNETNNNDLSVPSGCKMTIKNSIIWKDKIGVDTDATIEVTYSDVEGGFTGTGNIDANPMFCDSWSGTWPQLAGNYHLTYLSPAIGSGENGVNMGAFDVGCDIDSTMLALDEFFEGTPTEFALHENYPNPFNPTTTLRFDLPQVSDATVTIYNMLGQKVRTFNMNDTPAGYHSVTWNATNDYGDPVGAGMYLYQLRANQFVKTKKMVLLK